MCTQLFRAKIIAQKHIKTVHFINGIHAINVLNSLDPKSSFGSTLENYTTGGRIKGNRRGGLLTTDDGKRVFLRIFSRRLRSLLQRPCSLLAPDIQTSRLTDNATYRMNRSSECFITHWQLTLTMNTANKYTLQISLEITCNILLQEAQTLSNLPECLGTYRQLTGNSLIGTLTRSLNTH